MATFTKAEIKSRLLFSTTVNARKYRYVEYLGFSEMSQSRSWADRQHYLNLVSNFNKDTKSISEELSRYYNSVDDLRREIQNDDDFTRQEIEGMITKYGSNIWSNGTTGSFVTVADDDRKDQKKTSYRRHLDYDYPPDRVRIRTFVYCLTLHSACSKIRTSGSITTRNHMEGTSSSSVVRQANADRITTAVTNHIPATQKRRRSSEIHNSANQDPYIECEDVGPYRSCWKRRKHKQREDTKTSFPTLESTRQGSLGGRPYRHSLAVASPVPYRTGNRASSDASIHRTVHNSDGVARTTQPYNYTDTIHTDTNRKLGNKIVDISSFQDQQNHMAPSAGRSSENGDSNSDSDCVQVLSRPVRAAAEPASPEEEEEEPSLIVVLKIPNQKTLRQIDHDRKDLALKFTQAVKSWSQPSNVLEEVVKLIEDIRTLGAKIQCGGFGARNATHQLLVDEWLRFVKINEDFRNNAHFHGDLLGWDAYLGSLDFKERVNKRGSRIAASLALLEWRDKHPNVCMRIWSGDVARAVLCMTEQKEPWKTRDVNDMRKLFEKFNLGILDWYD